MGRHSKPGTPTELVIYTCVTDVDHVRITHPDGSVSDHHVMEFALPRQPFVGYRGTFVLWP